MKFKTLVSPIFLALALTAVGCGGVGDAPEAETTSGAKEVAQVSGATFTIDSAKSTIKWKAAKVTLAHDGGFKIFGGAITVENGAVNSAQINVDTKSIWSDDDKLTQHLNSPDFFDVANHPTAKFEVSAVTKVDTLAEASHIVTGNLTMLGKTNSVTFPANITVTADKVSIQADFIIDRTLWGIVYKGMADNLIENNVRIILDVVATPQTTASL